MIETHNITNSDPAALATTLQRVFDSLPLGVMIVDAADCTIVNLNRTYIRFFDEPLRNQKLIGRRIDELGTTRTYTAISSVIASGREVSIEEFPYDDPASGRTYWRWVASPMQADGRISHVVITAEEITTQVLERENMRNALVEEQRLRDEKELRLRELLAVDERITATLLEVAATVAGVISREEIMSRLVGMLPGFIGCDRASITLYDAEENVGRLGAVSGLTTAHERYMRELPPTPVDLSNPLSHRLLVEHKPIIINAEQVGEENPLNVQSALFVPMVARGQVLGYIGLDQSDTAHQFSEAEQRLMQGIANMIALALENAALLEANTHAASLAEANRLKDEFLSIASHELKTPMTTIQGYVQVLRRRASQEYVDRTALIRVVDVINDQTKRMNRLVDELLDVSRIEAGRLEVRHEVVDLEELLTQVVEQQQMTSERITIRLRVAEDAAHLRVMGDEARLQQVVLNLLSNALKYSPDKGSVTVALQHEADAAVVSVADTGVGISEQEQRHLFERFFRTKGARQSAVDGLGLGLYIASNIVKEHGGRIWVQSQPGQGSAFFFSIPLAQD